jgi:hypothetical protein
MPVPAFFCFDCRLATPCGYRLFTSALDLSGATQLMGGKELYRIVSEITSSSGCGVDFFAATEI